MVPSREQLARQLLAVYEDAELQILRLVRKAIEEQDWDTLDYFDQRYTMERDIRRRIQQLLTQAGVKAQRLAYELTDAEFMAALQDVYREVGFTPAVSGAAAATQTVQVLAAGTTATLMSTHQQVIRSVDDVYRRIVTQAAQASMVSGMTGDQAVASAMRKFANAGIHAFTDAAGRRWSMDSYIDMAVRTTRNQARQEAHIRGYEETGVELVRVSWHYASAPQCFPYQNELLAISGSAGPRTLVDPATGESVTVTVKDTLRGAIAHGFRHPNCRHRTSAYQAGDPVPTMPNLSEEQNQLDYDTSQRQRAMERTLRKWKRREAAALTPQDRQQAKAKIWEWKNNIKAHVDAHPHQTRDKFRESIHREQH